jgi:hypothetical protein
MSFDTLRVYEAGRFYDVAWFDQMPPMGPARP